MTDIAEVIQKVMSDPRIAAGGNFASKVYRDEPILLTASQMGRFTPPEIRAMRNLAKGDIFGARVFYEQGMFMESYEDDFVYQGEFAQYFPTYQHMTDAQLRGYFSWRTRARRGVVEKTSISFAFVHIYELLNRIGVASALDGFYALKAFWLAYRDIDPRIDSYVEIWLKDYVVYHGLDRSLLEGLPDVAFDDAVVVLLDYRSRGAAEVFSALNAVSSYDMEGSRFFKLHPDDVKAVVHRVFATVSDYHNRNPHKSARDRLFGRVCVSSYTMFKAAVFHDRAARADRVYEIGDCHKYICHNGSWRCERFLWYGKNNKRIGALLKTVDFLMRRHYGFASTLLPGKTNKVITGKIDKVIAKYLEDKRKNAAPAVAIDLSKLHKIRSAALETQSKLLVDEIAADEPPAVVEGKSGQAGLTDVERLFLHCLLHGQAYDDVVRSKGLLVSVLVDAINEKLYDRFNDTVIVDAGGRPEIVDDYGEKLKADF